MREMKACAAAYAARRGLPRVYSSQGNVGPLRQHLIATSRPMKLAKLGTDVTEFKRCSFGKAYLAPVYDFASKRSWPSISILTSPNNKRCSMKRRTKAGKTRCA